MPGGAQVCVIGCGVNCSSAPVGLTLKATSLAAMCGGSVEPDVLFGRLRSAMGAMLALWNDGGGYGAIRTRWLARALPLETPLTVRASAELVQGRFQGIDARGRLLLVGPDGPMTIEAGEVILSEASAAPGG